VDKNKQPGIQIGQILLERAEFSHREDALQLPPNTLFQPNLELNLQAGLSPDEKQGFLRLSVRTKPDEKPVYNFNVTMLAVLLAVEGQENFPLKDYLQAAGPTMLYPFVREAVAAITGRGHFGPVWLAPFNLTAGLSSRGDSKALQASGKATTAKKRPKRKPKASKT